MNIYIASDHAGFDLKEELIPFIKDMGHDVVDMGATSLTPDDDYPDCILPCAKKVAEDVGSLGIILGGSGQGEAMVANRVLGIRAAVFYGEAYLWEEASSFEDSTPSSDGYALVALTREHNDANILSLGARFVSPPVAMEAVRIFLTTEFSGDSRHVRRISKF